MRVIVVKTTWPQLECHVTYVVDACCNFEVGAELRGEVRGVCIQLDVYEKERERDYEIYSVLLS